MRLYLFIIFVLVSANIFAQASISGIVTDEEGNALDYATVTIDDYKQVTYTDQNGYFDISNISQGSHVIEVSYVGYKNYETTIEISDSTVHNVTLAMDLTSMEEIVVTGNLKKTYISNSPIKIEVVTLKQLNTYLPSASATLVDNIKLINGVQEVVGCGVCYTNTISINGLPGQYTAVLIDGSPMYGNLASVYGLNGIPNMMIDRFEVIKGPSSTLYGSEAVAGVINIITKDPKKQPLLNLDLMTTTHGELFTNVAIAPKIGKHVGYIGFNSANVGRWEDSNKDLFNDGVNLDRYALFTKWNFDRANGKTFSIAGKYLYEDRRNGVKEFLDNRAYRKLRGSEKIYGESIYTKRYEVFGTYEFDVQGLKLDFSASHHDQDSRYGDGKYNATQNIAFSNLVYNKPIKKHDLIFGATARYNYYDDNTLATQEITKGDTLNKASRQFIPGIFIQDEFKYNNHWTVLGGLRLDHYNAHGIIASPRVNVKYSLDDWTTARLNFGTGFRIVNLFTEDHAFISGQREVVITEKLNPEQSYNYSININRKYLALGGIGSIDIEGYYTYFTNKIIPDYDTPGKIIYKNLGGHSQTKGVSVSVSQNFQFPLSINIAGNLQSVTQTEPDDNGKMITTDIVHAPQWSGVATLNYDLKKWGVLLAYTASVTGTTALPEVYDVDNSGTQMSTPRSTKSKPWSLHKFQATKTFKNNFTLYGGVSNLFNFVQRSSPLVGWNDPNANVGFSQYFDTSYAYAPNHGREFYLGVRWQMDRK